MKTVHLTLLILVAASASAAAQGGLGTLDISVRDQDGKPVSAATVYAVFSQRLGGRVPRFTADSTGRIVLNKLQPGTYEVHAFKESDGYPDTFFSFFANRNSKAWQVVHVNADRTTYVNLRLGPKYATLKLFVADETGKPSGGSLTFVRLDDPIHPYKRGGDLSGKITMLVPTDGFRFSIEKDGYQAWHSKLIRLGSGQSLSLQVQLKRSP